MDAIAEGVRAVVLVEGPSDRQALEALAHKMGNDLAAEGVAIVAIGGATNIFRYLQLYGPAGRDLDVAGLCDVGELRAYRRGLTRAGFGDDLTPQRMEELGFFVCDVDLEDEVIRALGATAVEAVIEREGELASLRIMQQQPAQRGRRVEDQLRRFVGTRSGRKIRYGRLLVDALELERVPRPLACLLDRVTRR